MDNAAIGSLVKRLARLEALVERKQDQLADAHQQTEDCRRREDTLAQELIQLQDTFERAKQEFDETVQRLKEASPSPDLPPQPPPSPPSPDLPPQPPPSPPSPHHLLRYFYPDAHDAHDTDSTDHVEDEPGSDSSGGSRISRRDLYVCPFCCGCLVGVQPVLCCGHYPSQCNCKAIVNLCKTLNPIQELLKVKEQHGLDLLSQAFFRSKQDWLDHVFQHTDNPTDCDEACLKQYGFYAHTHVVRTIVEAWQKHNGQNMGYLSWFHKRLEAIEFYNELVARVEARESSGGVSVGVGSTSVLLLDPPASPNHHLDSDSDSDGDCSFIDDSEEPTVYGSGSDSDMDADGLDLYSDEREAALDEERWAAEEETARLRKAVEESMQQVVPVRRYHLRSRNQSKKRKRGESE